MANIRVQHDRSTVGTPGAYTSVDTTAMSGNPNNDTPVQVRYPAEIVRNLTDVIGNYIVTGVNASV